MNFDRYWEIFNEIDGNFDDMAKRTFKVFLPAKHDLRKYLTRKPVRMCVSSWTVLMSISRSKRTSSRERGRLRWSFKTEGISGQIGIITTDLGEILLGILDLLLLR